jgi:hypothetical protein
MKTTRRKFALLGGAAITAASLPLNILAQTSSPARQAKKFPADTWHQRLKRIMQVNFNEHDLGGGFKGGDLDLKELTASAVMGLVTEAMRKREFCCAWVRC